MGQYVVFGAEGSISSTSDAVAIDGLREARRALRRIDTSLGDGIRDGIREAAAIVADEAIRRAPRGSRPIPQGRSPRRRMADTIRPRVRGDTGLVMVTALQRSARWPTGYRYPRRIEYEGSGGQRDGAGVRAFLAPALAAKQNEVVDAMQKVVTHIEDIWRTA